jgi:hypothetical protein
MWFFLSFEIYKSGTQLLLVLFDEEGASQVENILLVSSVNKPKALFQVWLLLQVPHLSHMQSMDSELVEVKVIK